MSETEDKEAEWILFLLQNPPGYEFITKFNKDLEDGTIPKLKVIADKLMIYAPKVQVISFYSDCGFKDEDRFLYNNIKEYPYMLCDYLKKIDKDVAFSIKAISDNIPYIGAAWTITGKGFEVFERIIKNKIIQCSKTKNTKTEVDIKEGTATGFARSDHVHYGFSENNDTPKFRNIQVIRDNLLLAPKEFIYKALDYLENTDFSQNKYITTFIAANIREQLKYREETRK